MLDIAFARPALPKSGALVLLVGEGEKPSRPVGSRLTRRPAAPSPVPWRRPSSRAARARPAPSWRPARDLTRVVASAWASRRS